VPPEKLHWAHLYKEVVTSGLCTGCAGCIIACPHDVLKYDDSGGTYRPWKVEEDGGPTDCTHGVRGCTMCTRACPRFRDWEPEIDNYLFGRTRNEDEVAGVCDDIVLARATDSEVLAGGQDGGLVSAILIWALEHDVIDAALVSAVEGNGSGNGSGGGRGSSWKAIPAVARTRAEVLATAGSRYTYSANPLAYPAAIEAGAERIALVGMSCQASLPAMMSTRKTGKIARRLALSIGLLCSKTFDDSIFEELFEARYGLRREDISKINIKGVFQIWTSDGKYHEVPLKEGHAWTREGCKACPDFAAEHADISTGGIGAFGDWTLTVVRTEQGRSVISGMRSDGVIETRPGDDDPGAIELMRKLARASRRRWPATAVAGPGAIPTSI
jgi:coenzyme F420 hydrogenase subunit beta